MRSYGDMQKMHDRKILLSSMPILLLCFYAISLSIMANSLCLMYAEVNEPAKLLRVLLA